MNQLPQAARRGPANVGRWLGARFAVGLDSVFPGRARTTAAILVYHRVAAKPKGVPAPPRNVEPDRFSAQIAGLIARGYEFVSLDQLLDRFHAGRPLGPRSVVLTFDDGYSNLLPNALPVLSQHGVRATVFLASRFIGNEAVFSFDPWDAIHHSEVPEGVCKPLSWEECHEMADGGLVSFGSHTHTHGDFRGAPESFETDLRASLEVMGSHGFRTDMLSFPYGSGRHASPELATVAKRLGFRCALTTRIQRISPSSDPFAWGRIEGTSGDTAATLAAKIDGWYDWMEGARAVYRRIFN